MTGKPGRCCPVGTPPYLWNKCGGDKPPGTILADPNNSTDLIISQDIAGGGYAYYFSSNGGATFLNNSSQSGPFASLGSSSYQNWTAGAFFDPNGNDFYLATDNGLWVTTNSGGTWTKSTATGIDSTQGFYELHRLRPGRQPRALWGITWNLSGSRATPKILGNSLLQRLRRPTTRWPTPRVPAFSGRTRTEPPLPKPPAPRCIPWTVQMARERH